MDERRGKNQGRRLELARQKHGPGGAGRLERIAAGQECPGGRRQAAKQRGGEPRPEEVVAARRYTP
jgi:hypothetical protein